MNKSNAACLLILGGYENIDKWTQLNEVGKDKFTNQQITIALSAHSSQTLLTA